MPSVLRKATNRPTRALRLAFATCAAFVLSLLSIVSAATPTPLHTLSITSPAELKNFFHFEQGSAPLVSAHRGGLAKGYPENCLATFEHLLEHTPALIEVDPRFTKDGQIVLMHDSTLDRTTNGTGKVADHTLAEIRALKLKDADGNLTDYRIPTLDEALQWAKGKTVLIVDMKDVPIETRIQKIVDNNAQSAAIVMAYSLADAKKCHALNKDIVMEVFLNTIGKVEQFDNSGIPWENVVVFASHDLPAPRDVITVIHTRGARCIMGTSRNVDAQFTQGKINRDQLHRGYTDLITAGADILEADLALEAGTALKNLRPAKSPKDRFYP